MRERQFWIQSAKTALATVLAWFVAAWLLGVPHPFLAPYAAFFVVNETIYRSFANGAQQLGALLAGVLLAFAAGELIPWPLLALGVVVPVGLVVGRSRIFGDDGQWVAVTALLMLTYGMATEEQYLLTRVGESALGVLIGAAVNLLVLPPAHLRSARRALANLATDLAGLAGDMAGQPETRAWDWARRADRLCEQARAAQRTNRRDAESARWNPGHPSRAEAGGRAAALHALGRVAEELRHQADTRRDLPEGQDGLTGYRELLPPLAEAVTALGADPTDTGGAVRAAVGRLRECLATSPAPHGPLMRSVAHSADVLAEITGGS
ncbi:FUSC family protein [Crossiella sp. CA198]|uniref:FUSC family protein n=1 Tax=Crossiella sp. CA198 TaxID=3455607 RepID=UPI003F8D3501